MTTTSTHVVASPVPRASQRDRLVQVLRRFCAISVAGAVAGLVVAGSAAAWRCSVGHPVLRVYPRELFPPDAMTRLREAAARG